MRHDTFKLVEECSGVGDLLRNGDLLQRVRYSVSRYQGMMGGSGMPIPGLHRIEGSVDLQIGDEAERLVGAPLVLRLDDGRSLAVTLTAADGRILAEGHGPTRGCSCC